MISMGKILFAKKNDIHVLKFIGDVRVTLGPTLSNFLSNIGREENQKSVVIDLTETTNIDSTSLGLLAKISLRSQEALNAKPTIVSTNEDVNRILNSMGFEKVFVMVDQQINHSIELDELPTQIVSEAALREQVLEAHKVLMSLNAKNHASFCDLVEALEREQRNEDVLKAG